MFDGNRLAAERFLRSIEGQYYVYVLCRPDGQPFYVGKGYKRRAIEHELEALRHHPVGESNPFKCNVIRKIVREGGEVRYKIDSAYGTADEIKCLERESSLIAQHRRLHEGGCLTNLAGGVGNMSGSAPFSLERHAATLAGEPEHNPERATLNRFLISIGPVESVPVKPIRQISRLLPSTPHPKPRKPTPRCAYALVAAASASGLPLVRNITIPRRFTYQGVTGVIENGVARDILKSGMAHLVPHIDPAQEAFELSDAQIRILSGLVGSQQLVRLGLL